MGTFGSDHISANVMASSVKEALAIGYRMIDCARVYNNEREIGEVLAASKIKRSDLAHRQGLERHARKGRRHQVRRTEHEGSSDRLPRSLPRPLAVSQLITRPLRMWMSATPTRFYIHKQFMDTWAMENKRKEMARHIGVSNMTSLKLRLLLGDCSIRPFAAGWASPDLRPEGAALIHESGRDHPDRLQSARKPQSPRAGPHG